MPRPESIPRPRLPRLCANFAITADGKISTRNRTPSLFTSPADKRRLLEIRAQQDAVLVGAATVDADQMTLGLPAADLRKARTARGQPAAPLRVLLTNSGRIDPDARLFRVGGAPLIVASTRRMPRAVQAALVGRADLLLFDGTALPLRKLLEVLAARYGVRCAVCEGGPRLLRALLAEDLIDTLHLTLAPRIFGGQLAPTLCGTPALPLPTSRAAKLESMEIAGGEAFLRYRLTRHRTTRTAPRKP